MCQLQALLSACVAYARDRAAVPIFTLQMVPHAAAGQQNAFCSGMKHMQAMHALHAGSRCKILPPSLRHSWNGSHRGAVHLLKGLHLKGPFVGRSSSRQPPSQQLRSIAVDTLAAATALPQWDLICGFLAAIGAFAWVKIFDALAGAGIIDQKLSRKLVHSTAGPLFVLTWPFFSDLPHARLVAAVVPCINLTRLLLVGLGVLSDPGLVHSVSRQGDRRELLKGPLCYVLVLVGITLAFWRDNPAGTIAVSMMCGGDGFADIIGRRFGSSKLPWNPNKSWAGSIAMFVAGLAMASGFFGLFCGMGYFECFSLQVTLPYLAAVCGICTVVESLPIDSWFDDNFSVPLVAVAVSMLVLPLAASVSAACAMQQPQQQLVQLLYMQ